MEPPVPWFSDWWAFPVIEWPAAIPTCSELSRGAGPHGPAEALEYWTEPDIRVSSAGEDGP